MANRLEDERDLELGDGERRRRSGREGDDDMVRHDPARAPAAREGNGVAITAAVLGALGLLMLVLTFGGLFIIALPLGIAAMVLGRVGRRKVDRGETHSGRGAARAGWIMGLITTVLSVLAILLVAAGIYALGGLGGLEREVEQQQQQIERQQN